MLILLRIACCVLCPQFHARSPHTSRPRHRTVLERAQGIVAIEGLRGMRADTIRVSNNLKKKNPHLVSN